MNKQFIATTLVAALGLVLAGSAQAQVAGTWQVKVGVNKIMPKVNSGDLSAPALADSQIDIHSASALFFTANYFWTDAFSIEFLGGLPYRHTVVGAGAVASAGTLGTIRQISPTVLFEYHFLPAAAPLRPYVGVGPTLARFYDTHGSATLTALTNAGGNSPTTIGGETRAGYTVGAGLDYKINRHWFVDGAVLKTYLNTHTTLSTGQTLPAALNPVAINLSVGYRF